MSRPVFVYHFIPI